ncbi:hypothetical protein Lal_00030731 [Lupinus albus]|nr:hypothetical protein Lal_00030731 [Lupinus albus]
MGGEENCIGHLGIFSWGSIAGNSSGDKAQISGTPCIYIIMGITACETEHAERQMKLLEAQNTPPQTSLPETQFDS